MVQSRNLTFFYISLVVIAVLGAGGIWLARGTGGDAGPATPAPLPVSASAFAGYTLGSDTAAVEVIEYSDFQCPFCARFTILTMPDVKSRLIDAGRVRWVFRDFPLPGHNHAELAHHAAACAGEQNLFWPMHDQLYFNQGAWSRERRADGTFRNFARAIGADVHQYESCMDERRYTARIEATKNRGVAMGVSSTPTFIVGGLMVSGTLPYDSLASLIRRAEAAARR